MTVNDKRELLQQLEELRTRAEIAERAVAELLAEREASLPRSTGAHRHIAEAARKVRAWRCPECGSPGTIRDAERVDEYILHIECDCCKIVKLAETVHPKISGEPK